MSMGLNVILCLWLKDEGDRNLFVDAFSDFCRPLHPVFVVGRLVVEDASLLDGESGDLLQLGHHLDVLPGVKTYQLNDLSLGLVALDEIQINFLAQFLISLLLIAIRPIPAPIKGCCCESAK